MRNNGYHVMPGKGPYYPGDLGALDIKQQFADVLKAARGGVLTHIGTRIAQTPEGQRAIEQEALKQLAQRGQEFAAAGVTAGRAAAPWLIPVALIAAIFLFARR